MRYQTYLLTLLPWVSALPQPLANYDVSAPYTPAPTGAPNVPDQTVDLGYLDSLVKDLDLFSDDFLEKWVAEIKQIFGGSDLSLTTIKDHSSELIEVVLELIGAAVSPDDAEDAIIKKITDSSADLEALTEFVLALFDDNHDDDSDKWFLEILAKYHKDDTDDKWKESIDLEDIIEFILDLITPDGTEDQLKAQIIQIEKDFEGIFDLVFKTVGSEYNEWKDLEKLFKDVDINDIIDFLLKGLKLVAGEVKDKAKPGKPVENKTSCSTAATATAYVTAPPPAPTAGGNYGPGYVKRA